MCATKPCESDVSVFLYKRHVLIPYNYLTQGSDRLACSEHKLAEDRESSAAVLLRTLFCREEGTGLRLLLRTAYIQHSRQSGGTFVAMRSDSCQWWESWWEVRWLGTDSVGRGSNGGGGRSWQKGRGWQRERSWQRGRGWQCGRRDSSFSPSEFGAPVAFGLEVNCHRAAVSFESQTVLTSKAPVFKCCWFLLLANTILYHT